MLSYRSHTGSQNAPTEITFLAAVNMPKATHKYVEPHHKPKVNRAQPTNQKPKQPPKHQQKNRTITAKKISAPILTLNAFAGKHNVAMNQHPAY